MCEGRRKPRTRLLGIVCGVSAIALSLTGCGQTAKPQTAPSSGQVFSYFGSPFVAPALSQSVTNFDHSKDQVGVSSLVPNTTTVVPSAVISGTFTTAPTGFLSITENFAPSGSGFIAPQNPPLTGAWAVEIPGAGAMANLLSVSSTGTVISGPAAMAENPACPNYTNPVPYLYVVVPTPTVAADTADYGGVSVSTAGSAVTFSTQPFLVGAVSQQPTTSTGGCSNSNFGPVTAFPLNGFTNPANLELISMAPAGLLVSSFPGGDPGAFGGGSGVMGVTVPSAAVNVSTVVGAQYNGFFYSPQNAATSSYDVTVLASSYGDNNAASTACSTLNASLMANFNQGARTIAALPSANTIYGGEFLTGSGSGQDNDPGGANGSENCDVAIDLGAQDSTSNGLFPHATVFIGSNYPPFSSSHPWECFGTNLTCSVSFPAAAVVGTVQGQYVIFVVGSAATNPAAQLPNNVGSPVAQQLGIYLFQKAQ